MSLLLALIIAVSAPAVQPAPPTPTVTLGRTARIFSTVGHSEWCPAGHVTLDVRTGRYSLTPRAPRRICYDDLERPVREGTLSGRSLGAVRAAYLRVLSEEDGLEKKSCREGAGLGEEIIISNGGTPILVLTTGAFSASAPDDLSCWSRAAHALHDALDEAFGARHWR